MEEDRLCKNCKFKDYEHHRAGCRIICLITKNKITKGKKVCDDFKWS